MLTISHGHRRGFLKIGTAAFGGLSRSCFIDGLAQLLGCICDLLDRGLDGVLVVALDLVLKV